MITTYIEFITSNGEAVSRIRIKKMLDNYN